MFLIYFPFSNFPCSPNIPHRESFIFWGQLVCFVWPPQLFPVKFNLKCWLFVQTHSAADSLQRAGSHGDSEVNVSLCGTLNMCTHTHTHSCFAAETQDSVEICEVVLSSSHLACDRRRCSASGGSWHCRLWFNCGCCLSIGGGGAGHVTLTCSHSVLMIICSFFHLVSGMMDLFTMKLKSQFNVWKFTAAVLLSNKL